MPLIIEVIPLLIIEAVNNVLVVALNMNVSRAALKQRKCPAKMRLLLFQSRWVKKKSMSKFARDFSARRFSHQESRGATLVGP